MSRILGSTLLIFLMACPTPANARPPASSEARDNRQDLQDDLEDLADDQRDRAQIDSIVEDWHRARTQNNRAAERSVDQRLHNWLEREIAESKKEVREARQETQESQQELRQNSRRNSAARADDRRDLRDDQADANQARQDLQATITLANQLQEMQSIFLVGQANARQYNRKSQLLRELQTMVREEIQRDRQEIREDRQESREDRRR